MLDRISLYPGRVTLTPVSGQANTYDMVRADSPTQEGTPLNKANLLKDTTAALYGLTSAAVPDEVLTVLGKSVLAEVTGLYTKHETTVGAMTVGSSVLLKVDGEYKEFLVVHQGKPSSMYDDSCNGTWLLMKDVYENRQWHSSDVNDYANSTIHEYLNGTFLDLFDDAVQSQIKQAKIPYVNGTGKNGTVDSGANGLAAKVFLLAGYEIGLTTSNKTNLPVDGAKLSYFENGNASAARAKRVAYLDGSASAWWLRSPVISSTVDAETWSISANGDCYDTSCSTSLGVRPCIILPSDAEYVWYTDANGNIYTEQEVETQLTDVLGNLIQIPASQIKDGVKIEYGSYAGTNNYGLSNPNILTFAFEPKAVFIGPGALTSGGNTANYEMRIIRGCHSAIAFGAGNGYFNRLGFDGTQVKWWNTTDAAKQLNQSGYTYYYVAIG